jgi:hypothetical protein
MKTTKPIGMRAYGSIPHLPGSRRGPSDKGLSEKQSEILTEKARDKHDHIFVEEKLDGSCCSVAKVNGEIVSLQRAGYRAITSPFEQHHIFHRWVERQAERFSSLLMEGERFCGEWLALAHGTVYDLPHEPFVVFDLMRGTERATRNELRDRCGDLVLPRLISEGGPMSVTEMLSVIEPSGHGAESVEGAVWRVERKGAVDFLGKYVREGKVDGNLLPEMNDGRSTWNYR